MRRAVLSLLLPVLVAAETRGVVFRDATKSAGIVFVHNMGKSGKKMMVETMGSGGGLIDFDNDGLLDVYLVNGAPLPGYAGPRPLANAMYRNVAAGGSLSFTDVTASTGTGGGANGRAYGMGICAGDYDNDGFTDLYLANFGPNVLYHNTGDGSFTVATEAAGVGDARWGTSCAFLDYDHDGDLDLYVVNYVDFTPETDKFCGDYIHNVKAYCHPNVYNSQNDVLYRNNGDGTFTDASREAGLLPKDGNGLGVVTADYDDDGDTDLYVADDKTPNILYRNNNDGTFTDVTLMSGTGFGLNGEPMAGMGTDMGDYDGDGDLDIIVTNLDFENNSLYRNEGGGTFSDMSFPAGIGAVSLSFVGFGTKFLDYDNDGRLDLAVANGHILDNAPYFNDATTYAQRNFLFHGEGGGRLKEVGMESGPDMKVPNVARGLAVGDVDNDGDLDMLLTICGGAPRLMINEGGNANHWVGLRLVGRASNRSALGARARVKGPAGILIDEVRSGGSYLSQSDLRLHFGLGAMTAPPSIEIRWPSGLKETVQAGGIDRLLTVIEGEGVVEP